MKIAGGDSALSAQMAKRGNCRIYYTTYRGTGTYGHNTPSYHTFPGKPLAVTI